MGSCSKAGESSHEVSESLSNGNIREAKANIIGFMSEDNATAAMIRDFMASTLTLYNFNHNKEEYFPDDEGIEYSKDYAEESELKNCKHKLQKCMDELLSSEEEYVWNLKQLVMYVKDEDPDFNRIPELLFSNTREIYLLHSQKIYPGFKKAHYDLEALGNVFIQNANNLKMYIKKYSIKKGEFYKIVNQHKYIFKLVKKNLEGQGTLHSFLENPFRRIVSYCLALDRIITTYTHIISCAPVTNTDSEQLTLLDTIKVAKERLESLIHQIECKESFDCIKNSLVDLMAQGELLREDFFLVFDDQRQDHKMKCFLFEKALIFTVINIEDKRVRFLFFDEINTAQLGFTPPRDKSDQSFTVWYQRYNVKQYTLNSHKHVEEQWMDTIKTILWQQLRDKKDEQIIKSFSENRYGYGL